MNKEFHDYIDSIIISIGVKGRKAKEIREDLYNSLLEKQQATGENNPYYLMGDPEEVASDFRENLDIRHQDRPRYVYTFGYGRNFEYISKIKVFGIPLLHYNAKPFGVAKGIIAVGSVAVGVVSFGAISIGILSFGALCLGLIAAIGAIALSGVLSVGGAAVSVVASIGGVAIAGQLALGGLALAKNIAFGGYANANIAIGGVTKGIISVFEQHGTGQYLFELPVDHTAVINTIKELYPKLNQIWLNIIITFLKLQ